MVQDFVFGVRIHAGKGVVQNQDAGVADDRPGDCGALLLSAGKSDAAFAYQGLILLGKTLNILGDAGSLRGGADFRIFASLTPKAMFSRMLSLNRNMQWLFPG